jgi:ABC-type Fe3+/spermidine/putrescine transport system ATPase subunit
VYPVEVDGGVVDAGWLRLDGPRSAIAIAIPPDAVSLDPEGSITGRVISVRFQAGSYRSTIGLDGETTLVMENREAPRPGTAVSLTIDATRVAFLDS